MSLIQLTLKDVLDISILSFIIYYSYKLFKGSINKSIILGIFIFILMWYISYRIFSMKMTGMIFNKILSIGPIILSIIFQDDIKKFLSKLGTAKRLNLFKLKFKSRHNKKEFNNGIAQIVLATINMAKKKTGALIVIQQKIDLSIYSHTGEQFVSDINARLIENIFFKNSPLHDGAIIIVGNKIKSAGCILPVSDNTNIRKDLGLRHRSALGLSQKTDALIIIVSEERGTISLAQHGELKIDIDFDQLENFIWGL